MIERSRSGRWPALAGTSLIGCLVVIARTPSVTFDEVFLFVAGLIVGARVRKDTWKYWLACAISGVLFSFAGGLVSGDPNEALAQFPALFLFISLRSAAMTSLFALGFESGSHAWRPGHVVRGLLSDVVVPMALGLGASMGVFAVAKFIDGEKSVGDSWPLVAIFAACFALGAATSLFGRDDAAWGRAAALEGGVVIGLTASTISLGSSNLGPPLLVIIGLATAAWLAGGVVLGRRWRRRSTISHSPPRLS